MKIDLLRVALYPLAPGKKDWDKLRESIHVIEADALSKQLTAIG